MTKEQIYNKRGRTLEYSSHILDLAQKYRIDESKIAYIEDNYRTMENFMNAYQKGALTEDDLKVLGNNLIKALDINLSNVPTTNGYYNLYNTIVGGDEQIYSNGKTLNIFDSSILQEILENDLHEKERNVIYSRFGLNDGKENTLKETAQEFNLTIDRIREIQSKALRTLSKGKRKSRINVYFDVNKLSIEEQTTIEEIKKIYFDSNCMFIPDEKYKDEPVNINKEKFDYYVKSLRNCTKERIQKEEEEKEKLVQESGGIEDLGLSVKAYGILRDIGIDSIKEFRSYPIEEIMKIKNISRKVLIKK